MKLLGKVEADNTNQPLEESTSIVWLAFNLTASVHANNNISNFDSI